MWAIRTSSGEAPIVPRSTTAVSVDRVRSRRSGFYAGAGAVRHAADPRCTPDRPTPARSTGAPLIASTSAEPKGSRPPSGPAFAYSRNSDLIEQEERVSRKRVIRLMQEDGLEARARKRFTARDTDSRSSPRNRRITTSRLRPAANRPPRTVASAATPVATDSSACWVGSTRLLRELSRQSSVQENPSAQEGELYKLANGLYVLVVRTT